MSETPTPTTTPSGYTSVTEGGVTVTSSSETAEQITEALKDPISEAAATLGKKGGEAAAAKRREAKEQDGQAGGEERETGESAAATVQPDSDASGDGKHDARPLGKPRDDPRARMLEATRKEAEAKRERDSFKAERDRLAAELAEARAGKAPERPKEAPAAPGKPEEGDFENYADFVEARAAYAAQQVFEKRQAELSRHQEAQTYQRGIHEAVQTFKTRTDEFLKADPTFKERTAALAAELQPSFTLAQGQRLGPINVIADEIISSEQAPALMLHFTEHPDDLQRLQGLGTPFDIQREMAKLEGRLSAATVSAPARPEVSRAKPPVRPVNGSPHTADQVPGEDASYDEHRKYWNARDRQARR